LKLSKKNERTLLKELLIFSRVFALVCSCLLFLISLSLNLNTLSYVILACLTLVISAFIFPFSRGKCPRWIGVCAAIFLTIITILNLKSPIISPQNGTIVAGSLNNLSPEADLVYLASRTLPLLGGLSFKESRGLVPSIEKSYDVMFSEQGQFTSPLLSSLLSIPTFSSGEELSFCSDNCESQKGTPESVVIHLHGVGGNWSLLCWTVANAVAQSGHNTICPSLGPLGMWSSENGAKAVEQHISRLEAAGVKRIYLSGVSAGAVGVAEMAHRFGSRIDGLILLFGAHPDIDKTDVPTLFVYGNEDERFPPRMMEWVGNLRLRKTGKIDIKPVDGGHFYIVKEREKLESIIHDWFSTQ
jgi:predicted esterase